MPPELAMHAAPVAPAPGLTAFDRAALRLGAVWLLLIALFARDWVDMAGQWWNASTYSHVLLIPPILAWLVWQRLPDLRRLEPVAWWPALLPVGLAVLLWVLGAFAGFNLFRQAGAVALLPASALLLLGPRMAWALAFPLAYMAFLVPFGEELVPLLQTVTAHLTIALTRLSGIPAAINGIFIDTPAGLFKVAEACSGVKFLIAMVALGTLAAHLGFRSWRRRAAFMAFAVTVPILANGVRAWATIQAAQWVGAERATGFDHIIYGWVFFGLVIALVLGIAWRFFDRPAGDRFVDPEALQASPWLGQLERWRIAPWFAVAFALVLALGGKGWAAAAERMSATLPEQVSLPAVPGWRTVAAQPLVPWQPRADGAGQRVLVRYADGAGHQVDLFLALYAAQGEGREAGGYGQGAAPPGSRWAWTGDGPPRAGAKSERLLADGRHLRMAETYYRSGSLLTGSAARIKLATIEDRLLLRPRPTMVLILSAEQGSGSDPQAALDAFRQAMGPVDAWMDRAAAIR